MKLTSIISVLVPLSLVFVTGCAGSAQTAAKAPKHTAKVQEPVVVVPYDMGPPGAMDVSWEPTPPPPPKKVKALKNQARPHMVSTKRAKGRLFVLPTKFEH